MRMRSPSTKIELMAEDDFDSIMGVLSGNLSSTPKSRKSRKPINGGPWRSDDKTALILALGPTPMEAMTSTSPVLRRMDPLAARRQIDDGVMADVCETMDEGKTDLAAPVSAITTTFRFRSPIPHTISTLGVLVSTVTEEISASSAEESDRSRSPGVALR